MKLFVWADPYRIPYGTSAYFAIAETVEEPREIAGSAPAYSYTEYDDGAVQRVKLGEPTRVIDFPCGEWHMWSE